jgi:lipopolysaccharide/colanic/teichoic acid biosynthesis glycosyltransferase
MEFPPAVSAIIDRQLPRSPKRHGIVLAKYHERKALVDRSFGAVLLVISAPIIAVLYLVVRATSRGGGIYKQLRVGKDGQEFWLYKLRTMYENAEAVGGPQWAKPKDSRTTPVGRALRFLHLDELPQLVNVVRGEMSMIGPRPERPEFVKDLARDVPNYLERLKVLPGITGLAQVNLPADDSLESVERKVIIDCEYIRNGSASLDFRIFICTALRMMGLRHGRAPRWLGLEYQLPTASQRLHDTLEMSLDDTVVGVPARGDGDWDSDPDANERYEGPELVISSTSVGTSVSASRKHHVAPHRPK